MWRIVGIGGRGWWIWFLRAQRVHPRDGSGPCRMSDALILLGPGILSVLCRSSSLTVSVPNGAPQCCAPASFAPRCLCWLLVCEDVLRAQRERRTDTALNTGPKTTFLRCRRTRCCALRGALRTRRALQTRC